MEKEKLQSNIEKTETEKSQDGVAEGENNINKDLSAFPEMIESWISRKLVSEEKADELITKIKENEITFLEVWGEMFKLLNDRLASLNKIKDDPNFYGDKELKNEEKQQWEKQLQYIMYQAEDIDTIIKRLEKSYKFLKNNRKE